MPKMKATLMALLNALCVFHWVVTFAFANVNDLALSTDSVSQTDYTQEPLTISLLYQPNEDPPSDLPHSNDKEQYFVPVDANQLGSYVMEITIGMPDSRNFSVSFDTGSDLTWVQCEPCPGCYHQDEPLFDPAKSHSYDHILYNDPFCEAIPQPFRSRSPSDTCLYHYMYADGSRSKGSLAYDKFTLYDKEKKPDRHKAAFGCGHDNIGEHFNGQAGIAGMAQGKLSLVAQLGISIFSYCLVEFHAPKTKSSPLHLNSGGSITLEYTPLVQNLSHSGYFIHFRGISVNNINLNIPTHIFETKANGDGGFMMDSGTALTTLDAVAMAPFWSAVLSSMRDYHRARKYERRVGDLCYDIKGRTNVKYPTVVFHFEKLDLTIPQNNIFYSKDIVGQCIICFAFQKRTTHRQNLFGNFQQRNLQIAHDIKNKKMGFAHHNCLEDVHG